MVDDSTKAQAWSAFSECKLHRKGYLIVCFVAAILGYLLSLTMPVVYASNIKIANEAKETDLLIGLSNFGAWMKQSETTDVGIADPEVYVKLLSSEAFAATLGEVKIKNYNCDYLTYVMQHDKPTIWEKTANWMRPDSQVEDPKQEALATILDNISYEYSTRHHTALIQVRADDPVVAAEMADSAAAILAQTVCKKKKQKLFADLQNASFEKIHAEEMFQKAQQTYNQFYDSHQNLTSSSFESLLDQYEKERDMAFNHYKEASLRFIRAQALAHKTPKSFVVISNPTVALTPLSPRRWVYAVSFVIVAIVLYSWCILLSKKLKEEYQ